jgi:two-component system, OmpR family, KDP operon response regulator KdpE
MEFLWIVYASFRRRRVPWLRVRAMEGKNSDGSRPDHLTLQGVEIDFLSREVSVNGRNNRLTPREFALLRYLVAHPNRVLGHDVLLKEVWGRDEEEVEYLRTFVNQLRKKIEPEPSRPRYLLTAHWAGYRFKLNRPDG